MSGFVDWIGAQADERNAAEMPGVPVGSSQAEEELKECVPTQAPWQTLPEHNFPVGSPDIDEVGIERVLDRNPDIWMYRKRTTGLLRRYMRLSIETGRLPSLIGRELFRAKVTSYTATTFEARVIFVHDVEKCLERLAPFDQKIIARIVLQEYDHERAARILDCARKTIERRLPELIDELSEEFLRVGLISPVPDNRR
jgi:hypothetical protein